MLTRRKKNLGEVRVNSDNDDNSNDNVCNKNNLNSMMVLNCDNDQIAGGKYVLSTTILDIFMDQLISLMT